MKLGLDPPCGRNRSETSVLKNQVPRKAPHSPKNRLLNVNPRAQGKKKVFLSGLSSQCEKRKSTVYGPTPTQCYTSNLSFLQNIFISQIHIK